MMPSNKPNYLKALVICHGKCEVQMVKHISSNLHLPIKQYSKDKGAHSIQINDLGTLLNSKQFKTLSSFASEYLVEVKGKGDKMTICDFKLFIIMDTDDCTEKQKEDYISKELFKKHWLYDYIVPLYFTPKSEDVLYSVGLLTRRIKKSEKIAQFEKIFPINEKPLSYDTKLEVETFRNKLNGNKNTNITVFADYCLSLLDER